MCQKKKCSFGDGVVFRPNGIDELDPCDYVDIEIWKNVTVTISKCRNCGNVDISWEKQPNSEKIDVEKE